ncbi:MAG: diacylglycerol kinase family lipid kinase [Bacteroidaceae bacterium]|nr:diacylglycerol kinase family lipid kinase [Bacteroidaceae bacterium]
MNMKRILFIVNPISGTQGKLAIMDLIQEMLDKQLFDWHISHTEFAGHAETLAKQAALDGYDVVVAIGGDGTVNEVGRALVHTDTALGIIPCGSGNGLARHLGVPIDPKKAIEVIREAKTRVIDYGKINGLPFFCTCGVGFDAYVSLKFAASGKRGLLTYLENTLTEGLRYKPEFYEIEDEEGKHKMQAFLIACGNASQYGNNVYIAPGASINDGLLDVTVMEPFNIIDAPKVAIQLMNKTIDQNSHITTFRTRKLKIHRQSEGVVHFDGDPIVMGRDIDIEIVSNGLKVLDVDKNKVQPFKEVNNLLHIFSDFFNDLEYVSSSEPSQIPKRLMVVNRELLRKLKNNR